MNLHELLLNPGSRLPFRCELSTDRLDFPAVLSYTAAPVGEGFIVNNAGALTLRGTLSAAMRCVCDRCAAEFDREVSYPLDVPLASELQDGENPDYFLLEGDELDLEELLETVRLYFQCDGQVDRMARALYVHRNTCHYRLQKLKEKTGYSIRNPRESVLLCLCSLFDTMEKS